MIATRGQASPRSRPVDEGLPGVTRGHATKRSAGIGRGARAVSRGRSTRMALGGLDENKIEEIVARVLERLGGGGPTRAPAARGDAPAPAGKPNLPLGKNGVYADPDQ